MSEHNVRSVKIQNWGAEVVPGPLYLFLFAYFALYYLAVISILILYRKKQKKNVKVEQVNLLLMGIVLSAFVGITTNLVMPLVGVSQLSVLGPLSALVLSSFITYSILKHQLFDIRVVVKKVLVYTLLLGFVFGLYTLIVSTLTTLLPIVPYAANLFASLLIAFSFDPVRRAIAKWTERYLFVSDYNPNDALQELARSLADVVDLDEALKVVIKTAVKAMKLERGAAIVLRHEDGEVKIHSASNINFPAPLRLLDPSILPLASLLEERPEPLITEQLEDLAEHQEIAPSKLRSLVLRGGDPYAHIQSGLINRIHTLLQKLKFAAAVPVVVNKKLVCILLFGDKLSDNAYFADDVKFLQLVAATAANAIEKARFYEEDQIKSEFVSIASHELLTPTAAIEGYLSMILVEKMGKVDKQAEQYLQVVYKSAQRLAGLVKDLLSVSRIEGNRIVIMPKYFDLAALIDEQLMTIQPRATEKNIKLVNKVDPKHEAKAFADPEKVTQVFINLVGNAIKYSPKGSVTVEMADKGAHWEISVADQGIGMSKEDRAHLFEKFYRIKSDATMNITGTGLGLYISKSLITMMGGEIEVESTPGVGSTFTFSIPKHQPKA